MKKLTPEEQAKQLDDWAVDVRDYIEDCGAIREPGEKLDTYVTVEEIMKACGIHPSMWQAVKERMLFLRMPLAQCWRGHYLGEDGEQATILGAAYKQIRPRVARMSRHVTALGDAGEFPAVAAYSKDHLGLDLGSLPSVLGSCTLPLNEAIRKQIEAGENSDIG